MTVQDLISELEEMPPDLQVFRYCNWETQTVSLESSTPETDDGIPCVVLG